MKILYEDFIFEFGVHVFKSRGARHVLDPDVAVYLLTFYAILFRFYENFVFRFYFISFLILSLILYGF